MLHCKLKKLEEFIHSSYHTFILIELELLIKKKLIEQELGHFFYLSFEFPFLFPIGIFGLGFLLFLSICWAGGLL